MLASSQIPRAVWNLQCSALLSCKVELCEEAIKRYFGFLTDGFEPTHIINAFRPLGEKLRQHLFTIHFYLLSIDKFRERRVKSEEVIVKK